jgi:hypothetical protein
VNLNHLLGREGAAVGAIGELDDDAMSFDVALFVDVRDHPRQDEAIPAATRVGSLVAVGDIGMLLHISKRWAAVTWWVKMTA